jgi:hypothetical protein
VFTYIAILIVLSTVSGAGAVAQLRKEDKISGSFLALGAVAILLLATNASYKFARSHDPMDWIRQPIPCADELFGGPCQ